MAPTPFRLRRRTDSGSVAGGYEAEDWAESRPFPMTRTSGRRTRTSNLLPVRSCSKSRSRFRSSLSYAGSAASPELPRADWR
jgi:hypothetical protein